MNAEQCKEYIDQAKFSGMSEIRALIEDSPSVTPKQKIGKWIQISPADIYECSICGKNVMTSDICAYDFCHGCGAKMEGVKE